MTDRWVAVLGAGREQIAVIQAAQRAGYKVVATDRNTEAPGGEYADAFWTVSNRETKLLVAALSPITNLCGIVVAGTEAAVEGQVIAEALGLPHIGQAAWTCRDKYLLKQTLEAAGVPCTKARRFVDLSHMTPPAVIKPRYGSGSRGVNLWQGGETSLLAALDSASSILAPAKKSQEVLVEPYQPGPQLSTEAIIWDGRCSLVAMVDRHYDDSKLPQFVELGGSSPSVHDDAWRVACSELMARAAEAVGLKRGTLKGDIVLAPDGPKIIECHPRLSGGPLWKLALESTGIDYLPEAVRIACGEEPRWERLIATKNEPVRMNMNGDRLALEDAWTVA